MNTFIEYLYTFHINHLLELSTSLDSTVNLLDLEQSCNEDSWELLGGPFKGSINRGGGGEFDSGSMIL